MDRKQDGISAQAKWGRLIGSDLINSSVVVFILISIITICVYVCGVKLPQGTWFYLVLGGITLILSVYRGFNSAFKYPTGMHPKGAKAGFVSGLIYLVIIGAGLFAWQAANNAKHGIWATCAIALLSMTVIFGWRCTALIRLS